LVKTDRGLRSEWKLPNKVAFGASIEWVEGGAVQVEMTLWLRNGTAAPLRPPANADLRAAQSAAGFDQTTNDNKTYGKEIVTARNAASGRSISTQWEHCGRTWGNTQCPCMHSDPVLPDCAPGETVQLRGKLWFA
jgi:hypothetical protein